MGWRQEFKGIEAHIRDGRGLHGRIAAEVPQLARGQVWCRRCGHTEKVDSAACLRSGWPLHCGETMTIDAPDERKA